MFLGEVNGIMANAGPEMAEILLWKMPEPLAMKVFLTTKLRHDNMYLYPYRYMLSLSARLRAIIGRRRSGCGNA